MKLIYRYLKWHKAKLMTLGCVWMIITNLRQLSINHNRLLLIFFAPSTYLKIISQVTTCSWGRGFSDVCSFGLTANFNPLTSVLTIVRWLLICALLIDTVLHKWYSSTKVNKCWIVNHGYFWAYIATPCVSCNSAILLVCIATCEWHSLEQERIVATW